MSRENTRKNPKYLFINKISILYTNKYIEGTKC